MSILNWGTLFREILSTSRKITLTGKSTIRNSNLAAALGAPSTSQPSGAARTLSNACIPCRAARMGAPHSPANAKHILILIFELLGTTGAVH